MHRKVRCVCVVCVAGVKEVWATKEDFLGMCCFGARKLVARGSGLVVSINVPYCCRGGRIIVSHPGFRQLIGFAVGLYICGGK